MECPVRSRETLSDYCNGASIFCVLVDEATGYTEEGDLTKVSSFISELLFEIQVWHWNLEGNFI